jgi:tRNA 2-thiouridine synthesizing protein A
MPTLLARRALARAEAGLAIEILSDDPLAAIDVPHMCRQEGYDVINVERQSAFTRLVLRRPA